jgi:hypothetical protein
MIKIANANVLIRIPAETQSFGTTTSVNVSVPHWMSANQVKNGTTLLVDASVLSVAAQLDSSGTKRVAAVSACQSNVQKTKSGTLSDANASVPRQRRAVKKDFTGTSPSANASASTKYQQMF